MKILLFTRKIDRDDALAGFAYYWARKFAGQVEELKIITWQASRGEGLPENVELYSLPQGKARKIFASQRLLLKLLPKVDGVFCHMNPEYTILAAALTKLFGKRLVSWYTHKSISWRRRLMEIFAVRIVTASAKSFRRPWFPKKVAVIGHGIDLDRFYPIESRSAGGGFNLLTIGRISPTKNYQSIIKAVALSKDKDIRLEIVGGVILPAQKKYLAELKELTASFGLENQINFAGWVANKDIVRYYHQADLFINTSGTGSLDKVVLEALACGCLAITSNEAFQEFLPSELLLADKSPSELAEKINWLKAMPADEKEQLRRKLRQKVAEEHGLEALIRKIIFQFQK